MKKKIKQQNNEQLIEKRNLFIEFKNIKFLFSQSDNKASPLQTDIQFHWCIIQFPIVKFS